MREMWSSMTRSASWMIYSRHAGSGMREANVDMPLRINVITIFPEFFAGPLGLSIPSRAAAAGEELTLLCGHYKDIDQRVADHLATEEISLGDFVLSGGEAAALAIIDATVRLLPGAMSDLDSARTDSFFGRGLSAPSYTRP